MAGVSDLVTRRIAKEMGVALTVTEMVNDMGLIHAQHQTLSLAEIDEPGLRSVQIFGSKPETMQEATRRINDYAPDIIDINMGCPTRKIVGNGSGSALMLDVERAAAIVAAVKRAAEAPVTVKIRSGWDDEHRNAPSFAAAMQEAGASAITIHGRTREQFYGGQADWRMIAEVKQSVEIPVIGNGDIWQPQDAARMLAETGCDAVMIGRGAMGNPWLLLRTVHYLRTGELLPEPSAREKIAMAQRHLGELVEYKGAYIAVREMRKQCSWYIKGLPGASQIRPQLNQQTDADEMHRLLEKFAVSLEG